MQFRIPGRKAMLLLPTLLLLLFCTPTLRAQDAAPAPPHNGTIPAPLPATLPATPPAETDAAAQASLFTGILGVVHGDDFGTGSSWIAYTLVLDDGSSIPVQIEAALSLGDNLPANLMGAHINITGVVEGGVLHARQIRPVDEVAAASMAAVGTLRYANLLCLFPDTGITPEDSPAEIAAYFDNSADSIDAFFKRSSYGRLTIEFTTATAWRTMPIRSADYANESLQSDAIADACPNLFRDQIDLAQYDGVQFFTNADWDSTAGLGGAQTVRWTGGGKYMKATWYASWALNTIQHEIGHSLGMPHTDDYGPPGFTYDGIWDIMSGGNEDFLALHKSKTGWIPPAQVRVLGDNEMITVDLVYQHLAKSSSAPVIIQIPIGSGNQYYSLEAQVIPEPYYFRQTPGTLKGVLLFEGEGYQLSGAGIRQVGAYSSMAGAFGPGVLRAGDLYHNRENGFFVEVLQELANGYRVKVGRQQIFLAGAPNLRMTIAPVTNRPGYSAFDVRIANTGNAATRRIFVELKGTYLQTFSDGKSYTLSFAPEPSPVNPAWQCDRLFSSTVCSIASLAAGSTTFATFVEVTEVKTPYTMKGAAYLLPWEENLADNTATASASFALLPDLAVELLAERDDEDPEYGLATFSVINNGNEPAGAGLEVTFPPGFKILSVSERFGSLTCDPSGQQWVCVMGSVRAGSSYQSSIWFSIPKELPRGNHYIVAKVRTLPAVAEIELGNNTATANICDSECLPYFPPVTCTNCTKPHFLPVIVKR